MIIFYLKGAFLNGKSNFLEELKKIIRAVRLELPIRPFR